MTDANISLDIVSPHVSNDDELDEVRPLYALLFFFARLFPNFCFSDIGLRLSLLLPSIIPIQDDIELDDDDDDSADVDDDAKKPQDDEELGDADPSLPSDDDIERASTGTILHLILLALLSR